MNCQTYTSTAQRTAADAHVMMQLAPDDPLEVIKAATCQQSHDLSGAHSPTLESPHPASSGGLGAAESSDGSRSWSMAAVALTVLVAFGAGDSLLSRRPAQPDVEAAPLAQVVDLAP
jgi:hypothetical protein